MLSAKFRESADTKKKTQVRHGPPSLTPSNFKPTWKDISKYQSTAKFCLGLILHWNECNVVKTYRLIFMTWGSLRTERASYVQV